MAYPYKLTIPQDKGELHDLLGWMVLAGPDFADGLAGSDADTAFEELRLGLLGVLKRGAIFEALAAKSRELRKLCDANDLGESIRLLEEMCAILMRPTTLH